MAVPRASRITLLAASVLACSTSAFSQEQAKKQHVPLQKTIGEAHSDRPVPSLAVLNAAGAKLDGAKLVLTGVSPNTIVFADRPVRAAGHETTRQFLMQWDEDKGTFSQDPPNATVSVLGANPGEVSDAVLVLKSPNFDGTTLTFDVSVLEGSLETGGPVAVFIDAFAFRGAYGGGFAHAGGWGGATAFRGPDGGGFAHVGGWGGAGYWHAPVYHGAWYGHPGYGVGAFAAGAAVGAAVARPYYPPPACGYYPYPPCY